MNTVVMYLLWPLVWMQVTAVILPCFRSQGYSFTEAASPVTAMVSSSFQAQKQAGGTVVDEEGNPLQGVRVLVSKSTIFTTTDAKGRFSLPRVPDGSSLIFSFPGYKTYIMLPLLISNTGIRVRMVKDPGIRELPEGTGNGSGIILLLSGLKSIGISPLAPSSGKQLLPMADTWNQVPSQLARSPR